MAEKEEWREIDKFEMYEVSNFGRIRNVETDYELKQFISTYGYKYVCLYSKTKPKNMFVHKLVAEAFCENPNNYTKVDHINRNKFDNHYTNLRHCTSQENAMNRSVQSNNKSGIVGVLYDKRSNKWRAHIKINQKFKHVGYFATKEEAAEARKKKEAELFGEFAPK